MKEREINILFILIGVILGYCLCYFLNACFQTQHAQNISQNELIYAQFRHQKDSLNASLDSLICEIETIKNRDIQLTNSIDSLIKKHSKRKKKSNHELQTLTSSSIDDKLIYIQGELSK